MPWPSLLLSPWSAEALRICCASLPIKQRSETRSSWLHLLCAVCLLPHGTRSCLLRAKGAAEPPASHPPPSLGPACGVPLPKMGAARREGCGWFSALGRCLLGGLCLCGGLVGLQRSLCMAWDHDTAPAAGLGQGNRGGAGRWSSSTPSSACTSATASTKTFVPPPCGAVLRLPAGSPRHLLALEGLRTGVLRGTGGSEGRRCLAWGHQYCVGMAVGAVWGHQPCVGMADSVVWGCQHSVGPPALCGDGCAVPLAPNIRISCTVVCCAGRLGCWKGMRARGMMLQALLGPLSPLLARNGN